MQQGPIRSLVLGLAVGCVAIGSARHLAAQEVTLQSSDSAAAVQPSPPPERRFFTKRDAVFATAFVLGTAAMLPLDEPLARMMQSPGAQSKSYLGRAADGFAGMASPGALWLGGGLFVVGKAMKRPAIADVGLHMTESLVLATAAHTVLKGVAGRARPYVAGGDNSTDFDLFRGFGGSNSYRAFPSGHSSTAFAAASAITAEVSHWKAHMAPYVGVATYGGAAMVALSRMYADKHWASDVMLGAAIGTFSGWKVVQFHHGRPTYALTRAVQSVTVAPAANGGVSLGMSLSY